MELIPLKLQDRHLSLEFFLSLFNERKKSLLEKKDIQLEFKQEMLRFLAVEQVNQIIEKENLWSFITYLMEDLVNQIQKTLKI